MRARLPILLACAAMPACAQAPSVTPPVVFRNVHVVTMARPGEVLRDQVVVVVGDSIVAVGPPQDITPPADATVINGGGGYVMPGLVDAHVHLYDRPDLLSFLAHGVTTVFNLNGSPRVREWRDRIARGELVGPTIYTAGPTIDGDPPVNPTFVAAGTAEDGERIVAEQRRAGYDFIKVYHLMNREVYDAILASARREGMPVVGHIPRSVGVKGALISGQVMVAHAEEFFRSPADTARLEEMARLAAARGVAVTVNFFAFRDFIDAAQNPWSTLKDPEARFASPAAWLDKLPANRRGAGPPAAGWVASLRRDMTRFGRFALLLDSAGAPLLTGTDTQVFGLPGISLLQELNELETIGLSRARILVAATRDAGDFIARCNRGAGRVGRIAAGYRADLILLRANPLDSLAALQYPLGVMTRGRWLPASRVERLRDSMATAGVTARRRLLLFDSLAVAREPRAAAAILEQWNETSAGFLPATELLLRFYGRRLAERDTASWTTVARASLAHFPWSPSAHDELAMALLAGGDTSSALALARAAARLSPLDAFLRNRLARLESLAKPAVVEPAGTWNLAIDALQSTAYGPPTPRHASLRLLRTPSGYSATLQRTGLADVPSTAVAPGGESWWVDFTPPGERPIELRLRVASDTLSGYWVQGVGRRWSVTGSLKRDHH